MFSLDKKLLNIYDRYCEYMKNDTKAVEIGVYTVSGILFAIAYHKIRPITKFGKPSDIPNHFIKNRIRQYGIISAIDPSSKEPIILINHKPPLNFLIPSKKLLPVKLSGIAANLNGYSWLQTVAINRKVQFIPLIRTPEYVECQVVMLCPDYKKTHLDLSPALLSLGFGKFHIQEKPVNDPIVRRYYKYLEFIEKYAKKERKGLWSQTLPPIPWPKRIINDLLNSMALKVLPANRKLPELVR